VNFEPNMWAIFCDDVRQELGNKLSYLGIYGPNLIVPSLPTTLVKLCCVLTIRVPATSPPKRVVFRLLRDDDVIFEAELSAKDVKESAPTDDAHTLALTISTVAQMISFEITRRCILKARAIVDGTEIRGGALELHAAETKH
jgi:hypothetical protein